MAAQRHTLTTLTLMAELNPFFKSLLKGSSCKLRLPPRGKLCSGLPQSCTPAESRRSVVTDCVTIPVSTSLFILHVTCEIMKMLIEVIYFLVLFNLVLFKVKLSISFFGTTLSSGHD